MIEIIIFLFHVAQKEKPRLLHLGFNNITIQISLVRLLAAFNLVNTNFCAIVSVMLFN